MRQSIGAAIVVLAVGAGWVPVALAQPVGVSDRVVRGLFGSRGDGATRQNLDLSATLVHAYDDNLLAEGGTISPGAPSVSGQFAMLQAGGDYAWTGRAVELGLGASSAFRYYGQVGHVEAVSHAAAARFMARLGQKAGISVSQSAAYSPSYLFNLFPAVDGAGSEDLAAIAPDYALNDRTSRSYNSGVTLTRELGRRASASIGGEYSDSRFTGGWEGRRDMTTHAAQADVRRQVGRHSSLRAGYRYRSGDFSAGAAGTSVEHSLEFGMDTARVLSATRRATFEFGLGVSQSELPPDLLGLESRSELYDLVANAAVGYQFGRSWRARASYRRGLEYVAQLREPVFAGGFTLGIDGLLTRRTDLNLSAGYSSGASAIQTSQTFDTYTGSVRSRVALTQTVAAYVEYLYYFYDFGETNLLAPGLSPRLERQGARVGLTVWVPAFRR